MKQNRVTRTIQIIFIIVFSITLILPLAFINYQKELEFPGENRMAASFPEWPGHDLSALNDYYRGIRTWFADRHGMRAELNTLKANFENSVFGRPSGSQIYNLGKNGEYYLHFFMGSEASQDFLKVPFESREQVQSSMRSLEYIADYLEGKGAHFVFYYLANKESVYPESYFSGIRPIGSISRQDALMEYIQQETGLNALTNKTPLRQAAQSGIRTFNKLYDVEHWNAQGSMISYQQLMHHINVSLEAELKVLQESDFVFTPVREYVEKMWPLTLYEDIERLTIASPGAYPVEDSPYRLPNMDLFQHLTTDNPSLPKLLIYGDSYAQGAFIQGVAESFNETLVIHNNNNPQCLKQIIDLYQPDVVVFEAVDRVMNRIVDTYRFTPYEFMDAAGIDTSLQAMQALSGEAAASLQVNGLAEYTVTHSENAEITGEVTHNSGILFDAVLLHIGEKYFPLDMGEASGQNQPIAVTLLGGQLDPGVYPVSLLCLQTEGRTYTRIDLGTMEIK